MKTFSSAAMAEFEAMVEEYPNKRSTLMMALRLAEIEFGCIDDEAIALVAGLTEMSVAHVQGMVTFYTHFKRPFHGKYRFMVCATLMCALDGNTDACLKQIEDKLGIKPGERTVDGLFSCEKVECLADCDRPPVTQVNYEHYVKAKGPDFDRVIDDLLRKEGKTLADYRGRAGIKMDAKVPHLPVQHRFDTETETGNRRLQGGDAPLERARAGRTALDHLEAGTTAPGRAGTTAQDLREGK